MSSLIHLYTDFSTESYASTGTVDEVLHDAQLDGFETGYQAGWDDAVKAKEDEGARLTSDFVQSVQDMSFTYHEAYSKLSAGMQSLMSRFVTSVLPAVAQEGLHFQLVDQIEKLVESQSENAIELVVPPDHREVLEDILHSQVGIPFAITEEPSLGDGQVYLRVNQQEREIDVDAVLAEVNKAVDAFFHTSEMEVNHG